MKFSCSVDINASIDRVGEVYDSVDNLKHWQDGFVSHKHLSGIPNKEGAKSELIYKIGKRDMILTETILKNDLPHAYNGLYEFKEGANTMFNRFEEIDENRTQWTADVEYTEIHSFMMKIITKIFPGMFKRQTQKWMDQFKALVESEL